MRFALAFAVLLAGCQLQEHTAVALDERVPFGSPRQYLLVADDACILRIYPPSQKHLRLPQVITSRFWDCP